MSKNDGSHNYLLVLAGGTGTRFWPKSRASKPKQFLIFGDDSHTLLKSTIDRFKTPVLSQNKPIVITSKSLESLIENESLDAEIIFEPFLRGTGLAVYHVARQLALRDPKAVLVVTPADHFVSDKKHFKASVSKALNWANENEDLVILGVVPTRPETGFGYLQTKYRDLLPEEKGVDPKIINSFIEKPPLNEAIQFFQSNSYLWNSGIYCFSTKKIIEVIETQIPNLHEQWNRSNGDINLFYKNCETLSLEYAILQNLDRIVCFVLSCGWDDIGVWSSLEPKAEELGAKKGTNTVIRGDVASIESNGNIIDSDDCLVALLGVDNLIVVKAGNAILVAQKSHSQMVRNIVDEVKKIRSDLI